MNYGKGTREIRTSSFFGYKGPLGVSIANTVPRFYTGPSYRPLVPPWSLVKDFKDNKIREYEYTKAYLKQLSLLDPNKVYEDLWAIHGENPVLLCWERAGEFCHRRIVGEWLMYKLGIEVYIG